MSVGVLGDLSLCYPPTLHLGYMLPVLERSVSACCATLHCDSTPRLSASCFGAMSVGVL